MGTIWIASPSLSVARLAMSVIERRLSISEAFSDGGLTLEALLEFAVISHLQLKFPFHGEAY